MRVRARECLKVEDLDHSPEKCLIPGCQHLLMGNLSRKRFCLFLFFWMAAKIFQDRIIHFA